MQQMQPSDVPRTWGIYFHGTAKSFDQVQEQFIGKGGDANSTLGFFLSTQPDGAALYCALSRCVGDDGVVLVCAVEESKIYEFDRFEDFFGLDLENEPLGRSAEDYARLRQQLLAEGYTMALFGLDGDGPIAVALDPRFCRILTSLTLKQAKALQARLDEFAEPSHEQIQDALGSLGLSLAA